MLIIALLLSGVAVVRADCSSATPSLRQSWYYEPTFQATDVLKTAVKTHIDSPLLPVVVIHESRSDAFLEGKASVKTNCDAGLGVAAAIAAATTITANTFLPIDSCGGSYGDSNSTLTVALNTASLTGAAANVSLDANLAADCGVGARSLEDPPLRRPCSESPRLVSGLGALRSLASSALALLAASGTHAQTSSCGGAWLELRVLVTWCLPYTSTVTYSPATRCIDANGAIGACVNATYEARSVTNPDEFSVLCDESLCYCEGRPFSTSAPINESATTWRVDDEELRRMAGIENDDKANEESSTCLSAAATSAEASAPLLTPEALSRWRSRAIAEHASVASFALFTLELLHHAAPPSLIEAALQAALDEVRHARIAASLGGASPSSLPSPAELVMARSPAALAHAVALEGVVGEGEAVERMSRELDEESAAAASLTSLERSLLRSIVDDERRHATLAWQTLDFLVQERGVVASELVSAILNATTSPSIRALAESRWRAQPVQ